MDKLIDLTSEESNCEEVEQNNDLKRKRGRHLLSDNYESGLLL